MRHGQLHPPDRTRPRPHLRRLDCAPRRLHAECGTDGEQELCKLGDLEDGDPHLRSARGPRTTPRERRPVEHHDLIFPSGLVPPPGLEPGRHKAQDFKSCAATISPRGLKSRPSITHQSHDVSTAFGDWDESRENRQTRRWGDGCSRLFEPPSQIPSSLEHDFHKRAQVGTPRLAEAYGAHRIGPFTAIPLRHYPSPPKLGSSGGIGTVNLDGTSTSFSTSRLRSDGVVCPATTS